MKDRPLSVLILDNHCHAHGGASRVAIDEAIGLSNAGLDVTFIGAVGPIAPELAQAPLRTLCLNQPDLIEVTRRPSVAFQSLWNQAAYRATAQVLSQKDRTNTVVHLHGFSQALSTSPVRCALARGFQVVCTAHDFFSACPNGAFFDYQANAICTRRALSARCVMANCDKRRYSHKLYRVVRSVFQQRLSGFPRNVSRYIVLSKKSAAVLQPYLPADAATYVLPNPIGIPRLPPVNVAANQAVVAIGRLDIEKGIQTLIEAARISGVSLLLVGDGPLRAAAETVPGCRVTGWVDRQRVLQELERARCLLFPSLWYETYGLVVDEAAARGIPAIVSRTSAAAERVIDTLTGWHVTAGSVDELAAQLEHVKDDRAVQAAGRAAYEHYWTTVDGRATHIDGLLAIYDDVLGRRAYFRPDTQ